MHWLLLILFFAFAFLAIAVGHVLTRRRIEPRGFEVLPPDEKGKRGGE
jgi:hypothetical protein